jgi:serine/threonine protein kinase
MAKIIDTDLLDAMKLPLPEIEYEPGIHFIDETTVIKCVELTSTPLKISSTFRTGEQYLRVDEVVRRLRAKQGRDFPSDVAELTITLNSPSRLLWITDEIYAPLYMMPSRITREHVHRKLTHRGNTVIPIGSHISCSHALTETAIHQIVTEFIVKQENPHFVELKKLEFVPRNTKKRPKIQFTLSRCDRSLRGIASTLEEPEIACIIFQVLFALEFMHRKGLCHNDLHTKNVLLERYEHITWKDKKLSDEEFLFYQLDDKTYRIPRLRYCVRIADFELATSWADPILINSDTLAEGIDRSVPNFPSTSYDAFTFLRSLMRDTHIELPSRLLSEIMNKPRLETPSVFFPRHFSDNDRPYMTTLSSSLGETRPIDILNSRNFSKYVVDNVDGIIISKI